MQNNLPWQQIRLIIIQTHLLRPTSLLQNMKLLIIIWWPKQSHTINLQLKLFRQQEHFDKLSLIRNNRMQERDNRDRYASDSRGGKGINRMRIAVAIIDY